jgi:hypothetical protein
MSICMHIACVLQDVARMDLLQRSMPACLCALLQGLDNGKLEGYIGRSVWEAYGMLSMAPCLSINYHIYAHLMIIHRYLHMVVCICVRMLMLCVDGSNGISLPFKGFLLCHTVLCFMNMWSYMHIPHICSF